MQNNDPIPLYLLTKKTNVDHLVGSKASRTHTRVETKVSTSISNSQNSQRKTSYYNRAPLSTKNSFSVHVDTDEGGGVKKIQSYQNINNKMEKFSQQNRHLICKFYEGIYLIGNTTLGKTEILYQYGGCHLEQLLPDLVFPYGAKDVQKKLSDSQSEINEILYKRHVSENNPNCFILPIKTSESFEKALINQLIVFNSYLKCERVLCIVSYLPLIKYFIDFLIEVMNCAKEERFNNLTFTQYIQKCPLFETLPIQIPSQQIPQSYYEFHDYHVKQLKILNNALSLGLVAINIILERSVIFVAPNVQQLGAILMLFLKHVKWIHQMVASIPPKNIELLNVPVPLLGGLVLDDYQCVEQLIDEYPNVVFVDLFNQHVRNSQDFTKSLVYIFLVRQLQGKSYYEMGQILGQFQQNLVQETTRDEYIIKEFRQTQYFHEMDQMKQSMNVRNIPSMSQHVKRQQQTFRKF
ncbi:unnamed protein product (macronuclear) [Paramecium tetraurelia]|uniref:cDENN domain-containing protein n=1 Tax=Paramecium tetraurelia TaxID=5888 RepID=A0C920_PARTE|nr:uncharacterized protein GSPATT00006593001 [Paramecium tetraurelia]CAK67287.1 unnamed protein product [Paramecium tetraurelia]|eukprot:XP_001434684.1 hypothetical protein (macronuclear) [Paramecium tetraurelia strain d4-2]